MNNTWQWLCAVMFAIVMGLSSFIVGQQSVSAHVAALENRCTILEQQVLNIKDDVLTNSRLLRK